MYPKRSSSEFAVIAKAKDLADYVFEATHKSPIVFRFTFVSAQIRSIGEFLDACSRGSSP